MYAYYNYYNKITYIINLNFIIVHMSFILLRKHI